MEDNKTVDWLYGYYRDIFKLSLVDKKKNKSMWVSRYLVNRAYAPYILGAYATFFLAMAMGRY